MKIVINDDEHNIMIPLPTGAVFSPAVASLSERVARKNGVELPEGCLKELSRAVRDFRRKNGKFCILEVDSSDGEHVEIWV